jgi:tetratricopeptide (TPR) repeat protein
MKFLLLALLTVPFIGNAQSKEKNNEIIQRIIDGIVRNADQAVASNRNDEAEQGYKAALGHCDLQSPVRVRCKTDALWRLGRFYSHMKDRVKAEAVYKQRLDILVANQKAGARPDLDIGIALFELQSELSNPTDTSRDADETAYMEQARRFYGQCKAGFPDLRSICDRRLADVEGLHGSLLTLKKGFDEAIPFLKAVTDRPDSGVRREVLTGALKGYATILILQGRAAEAVPFVQRAQRLETVQK